MALDSITGSISWKKGKWNSNVVNQIQLQDECSSLTALLIFNTDKSRKLRTEDHPCLVVIILCGSLVRREKHKTRMTCTAGQLLDKIKNDQKVLERELSIVCLFVQCCFKTSPRICCPRYCLLFCCWSFEKTAHFLWSFTFSVKLEKFIYG